MITVIDMCAVTTEMIVAKLSSVVEVVMAVVLVVVVAVIPLQVLVPVVVLVLVLALVLVVVLVLAEHLRRLQVRSPRQCATTLNCLLTTSYDYKFPYCHRSRGHKIRKHRHGAKMKREPQTLNPKPYESKPGEGVHHAAERF